MMYSTLRNAFLLPIRLYLNSDVVFRRWENSIPGFEARSSWWRQRQTVDNRQLAHVVGLEWLYSIVLWAPLAYAATWTICRTVGIDFDPLNAARNVAVGFAIGIVFGVALVAGLGATTGIAFGVAFGAAFGAALGVASGYSQGRAVSAELWFAPSVPLGIIFGAAHAATIGGPRTTFVGVANAVGTGTLVLALLAVSYGVRSSVRYSGLMAICYAATATHALIFPAHLAGMVRSGPSTHPLFWDIKVGYRLPYLRSFLTDLWDRDRDLALAGFRIALDNPNLRKSAIAAQISVMNGTATRTNTASSIALLADDDALRLRPDAPAWIADVVVACAGAVAAATKQKEVEALEHAAETLRVAVDLDGYEPTHSHWSRVLHDELVERRASIKQYRPIPENHFSQGGQAIRPNDPRVFVDRPSMTARVERNVGSHTLFLIGGRRCGKTSLVNHLETVLVHKYVVRLDMQAAELSGASDEGAFYKSVLEQVRRSDTPGSGSGPVFEAPLDLSSFIAELRGIAAGRTFLVVFDEYECFEQLFADGRLSPQFLSSLRAETTAGSGVAFMFVGATPVAALGSRWASAFTDACTVNAAFFSRDEFDSLVPAPTEDFPAHVFTAKAVERLWFWTSGQPMLTNQTAYRLVEAFNDGVEAGRRRWPGDRIDIGEVDQAVEEIARADTGYLATLWQPENASDGMSSDLQRGVVRTLAYSDGAKGLIPGLARQLRVSSDQIRSELPELRRLLLVRVEDEAVELTMPLWRFFIDEHGL